MTTTLTIGVVGAGAMGRGIAQLYAQSGHVVRCFDAQPDAAEKAIAHVLSMLQKNVDKGKLTAEGLEEIRRKLSMAPGIDDLAGCDLVIEAVVEDLEVKRDLFRRLEAVVGPSAVLATNTSSLTVSEIASTCAHPDRVAGLHFFNPVPLMKVAEVIAAVRTSQKTIDLLKQVTESTGHRAVVTADQPGFLVNHAGRGLYTEGLRILEEQVADAEDVDDVLREGLGFRMGPFELLDLTGLDVSSKVMTSIYEQFHQEPRFRPSSLIAPRVAAGLFGRKTDSGWYDYVAGQKQRRPAPPQAVVPHGLKLWIDGQAEHRVALRELAERAGASLTEAPADADVCVLQPWGTDATTEALKKGTDPVKSVALEPMTPFGSRRSLMLTAVTSAGARDSAYALLTSDSTPATVIGDSAGFIAQRVLATIVNIACNIAQRGIASIEDLEDAVRLGLGYPHGPLGWGDRIGATRILAILDAQYEATRDPRYRPSPWLVRRASLGLSLLTPEAKRHS